MKTQIITLLFLLLAASCDPTATATLHSIPGVDAGNTHSAIQRDLFVANTDIPLVLLMANLPDRASDLQPSGVYYDYYSSRFTYNAQDYLLQVSSGMFTFEFQGVWGPYDISEEDTDAISKITASALRQAVESGFNVRQFDKDSNGILQQDELMIMVVDNGTVYGGAARWLSTRVDGVKIQMYSGIHGSHANLATIAHEITHLLGTIDLYGSNCNSFDLTLMSCTGFGRAGDDTVHLDPWHKMHLGWVEPRIVSTDEVQNKTCYTIEAPQFAYSGYNNSQRPLLIYNPNRNGREYFMVEFRNPFLRSDDLLSYERLGAGVGVAIWSIRVGEDGYPLLVPSLVTEGGWDFSLWTYGASRDTQWQFTSFPGLNFDYNIVTPEMSPSRFNRSAYLWAPGVVTPQYQDGIYMDYSLEVRNFDIRSSSTEVCLSPQNMSTAPNL